MAYFNHPTISKFKRSVGRIRGNPWTSLVHREFIVATELVETDQIRCSASIQDNRALLLGIKNGTMHSQRRCKGMFNRILAPGRSSEVMEEKDDRGRGGGAEAGAGALIS